MAGIARRNIAQFRERRRSSSTIDLLCQDALTYDFLPAIVLYLYNPFGPDVMRSFTENLRHVVGHGRHDLYIAYRNQTCAYLFDAQPFLEAVEKRGTTRSIGRAAPVTRRLTTQRDWYAAGRIGHGVRRPGRVL